MSTDGVKLKSKKKKEVSDKDVKKKKPKKGTLETSGQPFNLSFIDKFYQARTSEQSWKEEGQNYVWIKDKKEVCVIGEVTARNPETNEFVVTTQDGTTHSVPLDSIFPMNPPDYDYCEDLTSLYHLNDLNLFQNIKMRFEKNLVYTFVGNTLLFLNPYQTIAKNYSTKKMTKHIGARKDTIEPHIYSVGDKAYFDVIKLSINQSILLSGVSSSGKTENLKHLIEYIGHASNEEKRSKDLLNSLTLMESFGNLATLKNVNSSSMLNLVELNFSKGKFTGSLITSSFINSHRVIFPKNGRNFHIFYQIFSDENLVLKYNLKQMSEYKILNSITISGLDDESGFKNLKEASNNLNIPLEEFIDIVVAILRLGNLTFEEDGSVTNKQEELSIISGLLKIEPSELGIAIQGKSKQASTQLTLKFCEVLYYHTFNNLVKEINQRISSKEKITNYISIVDIPGNQHFHENYFDQFLVNFANDKLNYLNNDVFFKKEQEIYVKERIDWKYTDFDIKDDYIENESKFLDEIETNEIEKIQKRFLKDVKSVNEKVQIEHFDDKVTYEFDKIWFDANLIQFVSSIKSKSTLIDKILNDMNYKIVLTQEIKKKLSELWAIMQSTRLQKVLCFIPNEILKPSIIEPTLLLDQIVWNNILQTIKMTRKGYIDHFQHSDFVKRYFMLTTSEFLEEEDELSAQCKLILRNCGFLNTKQYKIGKNSVLLRYSQIFILEELRAERIVEIIIGLQAIARQTIAKKNLEKLRQKREAVKQEEEEKLLNRMESTVKFNPNQATTISALARKQTLGSIMLSLKTGKSQTDEDENLLPISPNQSFRMKSATIKGPIKGLDMMTKEKKQTNANNDQQLQSLQENYDRTRKFNADLSSEILELKNTIQILMIEKDALTKKVSKLEEENNEMKAYQDTSKIHEENKSLKEKIVELLKQKEESKFNMPSTPTSSEDPHVIQTKSLQRKSSLFGPRIVEKIAGEINAETNGPKLQRKSSLLSSLTPRFTLKDPTTPTTSDTLKVEAPVGRKRRSFTLTSNPLQRSPEKSPRDDLDRSISLDGTNSLKKPSFTLGLLGKKKSFDSFTPSVNVFDQDSTPEITLPAEVKIVDKIFNLLKSKSSDSKLDAIKEIELLLEFNDDFEEFCLRKGVSVVFGLLNENNLISDSLKLIEKFLNHDEANARIKKEEHVQLIEMLHNKKDENVLILVLNCLLLSIEKKNEKFFTEFDFQEEDIESNLKHLVNMVCSAKSNELNEKLLKFLTFTFTKHFNAAFINHFSNDKFLKRLVKFMDLEPELIANESVNLMIKILQKDKTFKQKLFHHKISKTIKKILTEGYVKTNTEFLYLVIDVIPLLYDTEETIKLFDNSLLFPLLNVTKLNQCIHVLKALETLGKLNVVKKEIKSSGKIQIIFSFLSHKNKDFVEHSLKVLYILLLGEEEKNLVFEERHVDTIVNLMKTGRKNTQKISSLIIEKLCENEKMKTLIVDKGGYSTMKSKVNLQRKPQFAFGNQLSPRNITKKDVSFGSPVSSPRVSMTSPLASPRTVIASPRTLLSTSSSPRTQMSTSDPEMNDSSPVVSANDLFSPLTVVESKSWMELETEKISGDQSSPNVQVLPTVSYSEVASSAAGTDTIVVPSAEQQPSKDVTEVGMVGNIISIPKIQLKQLDGEEVHVPQILSPLFQEYQEKKEAKEILKIHVGNLNFKTKEKDIIKKFSKFGKVISCEIPVQKNQNSKKSHGYAVIEMKKGEAEKAIEALNKTDLNGRKIYCKAISL